MEREPEQALRCLALLYNEDFLYGYQESRHAPIRPVQVDVIKISRNGIKDRWSDLKHAQLHDVFVRVSAVERTGMSYPYVEIEEIKWEGKLQDWYQACADIVKDITQGSEENE